MNNKKPITFSVSRLALISCGPFLIERNTDLQNVAEKQSRANLIVKLQQVVGASNVSLEIPHQHLTPACHRSSL